MNRKGKLNDLNDIFKAIVTGIIGIIFLGALAPIVSQEIIKTFAELGVILIVVAIIIYIVSKIKRF